MRGAQHSIVYDFFYLFCKNQQHRSLMWVGLKTIRFHLKSCKWLISVSVHREFNVFYQLIDTSNAVPPLERNIRWGWVFQHFLLKLCHLLYMLNSFWLVKNWRFLSLCLWKEEKEKMSYGGETWYMGMGWIYEELKNYACVWSISICIIN